MWLERKCGLSGMSAPDGPAVLFAAVLTPDPTADVVQPPSRAAGPGARGAGTGRRPAPPDPPVGQYGAACRRRRRG